VTASGSSQAASSLSTKPYPLAGGLRLRPAGERGMADLGWLHSAHSFSFADYQDPDHVQFENLWVINDDQVAAGKGFGEHPHRDFEIFSYVLEGELEHKDSMGNGSTVPAGGVQYMSTGAGVTHSEFNPSATNRVRLLQIWLLPNVLGEAPCYDTLQIPAADKDGRLKLFLSPNGRDGSIQFKASADIHAATLSGDQAIDFNLRNGRRGWIQVARGSLMVNGQELEKGDGLAVSESGLLQFSNGEGAEFILFDMEAQ
jgi:redox-sensitive bicupin YhaK (pirin superfamily)